MPAKIRLPNADLVLLWGGVDTDILPLIRSAVGVAHYQKKIVDVSAHEEFQRGNGRYNMKLIDAFNRFIQEGVNTWT